MYDVLTGLSQTTIRQVCFFNDGHAGCAHAVTRSLEAVLRAGRPVHLVLSTMIESDDAIMQLVLAQNHVTVRFFGPYAPAYARFEQYPSLAQVLRATLRATLPGDRVLFSPGVGCPEEFKTSFERVEAFSRLVAYFTSVISEQVQARGESVRERSTQA